MSVPTVLVHRDPTLLARAVAARLVTRLVDAQAAHSAASLVLTGGRIGIATLAALADAPAREAVDWKRLDLWWGDERYLPAGHPDRNETQARQALLDQLDLDPGRIHGVPAADDPRFDGPEAAAEWSRTQLSISRITPGWKTIGPVPGANALGGACG